MWEFIDKIIYINLDDREDRRLVMKSFFERGHIPLEMVVRFPAIKRSRGALGCAESHMEVLKLANKENWKNVLILEDDLEWTENFQDNYQKLEELTKLSNWDVIMLTGWYCEYNFPRIFKANNTGAYLVNESYRNTLLNNRQTSVNKIPGGIGFGFNTEKYNADVHWHEIMKTDNWYGLNPCICRQIDGFSDIAKRVIKSSKIVGVYNDEIRKDVYKR
jgi:glycosyl transferase family 25